MTLAIAHRGYSARYPENSLTSMRRAIESHAHMVETDVRLSADGEVFCTHDPDLRRLANDPRTIADTDALALRGIALAGGERLVTLAEVLMDVAGRVPVLIDVKTADRRTAEAVLAVVQAAGRLDRVWFGLRAPDQAAAVRALAPAARCLAFVPTGAEPEPFLDAGALAVRVWEGQMDEPGARRLLGRVPVWATAGGPRTGRQPGEIEPKELRAVIERGAQAVLLNDPTLLTGWRGE